MLRYCTKCDEDANHRGGDCPICHTSTHIISRDAYEKCAVCGKSWQVHGALSSPTGSGGASACPTGGGTFASSLTTVFTNGMIVSPTLTLEAAKEALSYQEVVRAASGMKCAKCGDYNEYAQPNQANSEFVCYGCRH